MLVEGIEVFPVRYEVLFFSCLQMQSTVVKHKKDGGLSGGNFDSYNIIRVRCHIINN